MSTLSVGTALVVLLWASGLVSAGLAAFVFRQRETPGRLPLVGFLSFVALWSLGYGAGLTTDVGTRQFWGVVQWFAIPYIPVCWLLFALEYTGYEEYSTPRTAAALSVLPAGTTLAALTNEQFGLMWREYTINVVDGLALVTYEFEPWLILNMLYGYALILAGMVVLLRLVVSEETLYTDQAISLVVGMAVPWVANFLVMQRMVPVAGFDYTPFSFAVTGVAFSNALFRYRLFQLLPAIRSVGRDEALEALETGVVVLDEHRNLIYLNPAATDIFGVRAADVLGEPIDELVTVESVDFDAPDSLGELSVGERTFEVRSSPIVNHREAVIGYSLLFTDITHRQRYESRLQRQRDELEQLRQLNTTIRSVNAALVSATSREEMAQAVCDRLAETERYVAACTADVATWKGNASRWTTAGPTDELGLPDPDVAQHPMSSDGLGPERMVADGGWTVVPLVYGRTVYGVLGVLTGEEPVPDAERGVLTELGELVGHAVNAMENRQLLSAERVVEVELESPAGESVLATVAETSGFELTLEGLVPATDDDAIAYVRYVGGNGEGIHECFDARTSGPVRPIQQSDGGGLLEWTIRDDALLQLLDDNGAHVRTARADGVMARYTVDVCSDADLRKLLDQVQVAFPNTRMVGKTEHDRHVDQPDSVDGELTDPLTDRQQETLEAAFRAGYFDWPRESTAEEVAETLDITRPTLQAHLRKAENKLLTQLFEERRR